MRKKKTMINIWDGIGYLTSGIYFMTKLLIYNIISININFDSVKKFLQYAQLIYFN